MPANEHYHGILEESGVLLLLLDAATDGSPLIVEANRAALAAHGYGSGELVGQPLTLLDPSDPRELSWASMRALEPGECYEVRHRRKDRSWLDLEVRACWVEPPGKRLIAWVGRDITAQKSTIAALEHSRELMSYVIAHARSAIAVHDRDLRYIYVSERYLKEYKVEAQDVIGKHHYEVFPDLPQKWRDVHQRALAGEVSSAEEDPYHRSDGTVEWTRWECRPWYESDGSIGGIIVYTEVITDRKRAEQEKHALQDQLQQAMKMEAVGRLAGGIAHDFNNLLTAIMGHIGLATSQLQPSHPLNIHLNEAMLAATSAASLTRQLLSFSRKQILEPKLLDLNELLARTYNMLVRLIGEDIALRIVQGPDLAPVKVDPGQLEQVLVNLSVNARDAMPDGGSLVLETSNVVLDQEYCASHPLATPGRFVCLAVSDTGIGMDPAVKARLFEPFFTTKPMGRGTGLGLATTFGAVKQAGGSLDVDSEPGKGTTFRLYLPAAEGGPTPHADKGALPGLQPGSETVLLVEDEELVRRLAHRILEQLGYRVLVAESGARALALAAHHPERIDLLMTDLVMPLMDGRELYEKLRPIHPETQVLYTSGYTEDVVIHHGVLNAGMNFLGKPYSIEALAIKLREVLASAAGRPEPLRR